MKLGVIELEAEELLLPAAEVELPEEDGRKSIQGTATCFPLADALDALLDDVLDELLELGVEELDELPLNEIIPNSNRPEFGLMMKSLIVPIWLPDELVT